MLIVRHVWLYCYLTPLNQTMCGAEVLADTSIFRSETRDGKHIFNEANTRSQILKLYFYNEHTIWCAVASYSPIALFYQVREWMDIIRGHVVLKVEASNPYCIRFFVRLLSFFQTLHTGQSSRAKLPVYAQVSNAHHTHACPLLALFDMTPFTRLVNESGCWWSWRGYSVFV